MLERDFLLGRERERTLQSELEAVKLRLLGQERLNLELGARQGQLLGRVQQQQVSLQREEAHRLISAEVGSNQGQIVCCGLSVIGT